ncbi:unnamed protein product [Brugia timori]|uniref:Uncharacterized protein n=1 Tax=Brugia timori TaxID=42155 RepID=A0A0R3QB79_9BILA|nr:unnamed protein product [Brugia timori]
MERIMNPFVLMLRSFQSKDDEYGLTEIIMDDPNNSRKTSWRRDRANKEDIRQISSCSEENRGRRNDHKMTFDEKSMKISKLSSTSFASSNTSNCSEKQLEGNSLKRKYFEAKEQSTNKFSNTTNETIKGDESLKGTEYSPSEENYTQSDSFASSRFAAPNNFNYVVSEQYFLIIFTLSF